MDDFNTAEYVVTQAKEGKNFLLRRLLLAGYVAFAVGFSVLFVSLKLVPVVAVMPLLLWIIVHFTWRRVNVEHKYTVAHGRVTFSESYSSGADKILFDLPASDIEYIGALPGAEARVNEYSPAKTYDLRGRRDRENAAAALFEYGGKKIAVLFAYDKKTAALLKLYNKNTEL